MSNRMVWLKYPSRWERVLDRHYGMRTLHPRRMQLRFNHRLQHYYVNPSGEGGFLVPANVAQRIYEALKR